MAMAQAAVFFFFFIALWFIDNRDKIILEVNNTFCD